MDARNLAIVFGPTLVKKKDDDMASIVKDMSDQCRIIESIILHVSTKWCIFTAAWLGKVDRKKTQTCVFHIVHISVRKKNYDWYDQ